MAFDKVKTLRAAEKYLEMGKIAAAIKEYCQIVAVEPDDFTTLNMLGDMYTRVGDPAEAVSCFRRIAEHYREQGFGLKAIAMYKKIDRLQPNDIDIASHLADLYAQQDLVVEARAHYLTIVEAHNRSGATKSALEVLQKIADLDPQHTQIRIKLAHGYLKEGLKQEAAASFTEAGRSLLGRGALDEALAAFAEALQISPSDYATLKGIVAAHTARGTADEAAEILEHALANNSDDRELLSMLADAYVEADEPEQADRFTALLVAKESTAYLRFIEIAHLYLRHDNIAAAVRVVTNITEQMLAEREHAQLLSLIDELLVRDSDNVEALRLLVRSHWWLRDMDSLKAALERLAEAAEAAGLKNDERYALTQLTRLVPGQAAYIERLNELGGAEESAASETLPQIEGAASLANQTPATAEFVQNSQELAPPVEETTLEWNPVTEVSQDWTVSNTPGERDFSFEAIVAEELPPTGDKDSTEAEGAEDSRVAAMRRQELESVDFYIAQGYADIAIDTLDLLEQQAGSHEEIELRRQRIRDLEAGIAQQNSDASDSTDVPLVADDTTVVPVIISADESAPADVASGETKTGAAESKMTFDAGLAEIFEEHRAFTETEGAAVTNGDYETHYNLGLAYKEMDLFEDALEEFQIALNLTTPSDGTPRYLQCCNLLGHCFVQTGVPELAVKWFTKALHVPGISDDERTALSYEVAVAYEQAGDLNRALEFFTEVYGVNVSYRSVNERLRTVKARLAESDEVAAPVTSHSEQLVN
jgi:tetratricopeptide (TPR) repeat protein